jgi:ABC-type multidrug transport system permease subunit
MGHVRDRIEDTVDDIIMKHGFEIGLVIAWVTGLFVLYAGGPEFKRTRTGNTLRFILGTCLLLTTFMYFGLRLQGVNP